MEIEDLNNYKKMLEAKFRKYCSEHKESNNLFNDFFNEEMEFLNKMINLPENNENTFLSIKGYGRRCAILGAFIEEKKSKLNQLEIEEIRKKEEEKKKEKKYWDETERPIDIIFRMRDDKKQEEDGIEHE